MNIIGQNGNDGEHYEEVEPTEQAVKDYVKKTGLNPFKNEDDWTVIDEDSTGDFKDFNKNYAKYMIIEKDGTRTFLDEKPTFETKPNSIVVTLSDGRKGKINRGDDSRIIYM